jgi:hypothetical protein
MSPDERLAREARLTIDALRLRLALRAAPAAGLPGNVRELTIARLDDLHRELLQLRQKGPAP